jgi:hypothetical protein
MAVADVRETSRDLELVALQEEWAPGWSIWRARRRGDPPGVGTGEFVAARAGDEAGAERTVMRPTAAELDAVLRWQQGLSPRGTVATRMSLPIMWAQR